MRLAVIIPLANEEKTVPELLARVAARLGPEDAIFCIVDNASRDNTRGAVERFAATSGQWPVASDPKPGNDRALPFTLSAERTECAGKFTHNHSPFPSPAPRAPRPAPRAPSPQLNCVWAPENRCVVDAYFRGYREAYETGAEWILEMDGGLSHLPEEIPRFIAAMESGVDFAGGSRFIKGGQFNGRLSRRTVSFLGTWLANMFLDTKMFDMTSGFECFNRKAMQSVLEHGVRSQAHFFQTEIRYLMHRLNWVEVPITYSCPSKSVGKNSLLDAFKSLYALWREHREAER